MRDRWLCPQLDWPSDPFADANMTTTSTAPLLRKGKPGTEDYLCRCGCKLPHNYSVSRLTTVHDERIVLWYRHVDHRNRHASKERDCNSEMTPCPGAKA
jgi:hypothetical protein